MSEDHQSNDPWHLISAHQYEKAVAAYDAVLAAGENYPAIVANRAIALLCLGRLSEALEGFATANDIARQDRGAPKSAPTYQPWVPYFGSWAIGALLRSCIGQLLTAFVMVPSVTRTPPVVWVKACCSGTRVSPPKTGNTTEHALDYAVLRLITSSYLVGACTGNSDGFSPLRILLR
jgi:tetratricopeptide (TPR) repeat protein